MLESMPTAGQAIRGMGLCRGIHFGIRSFLWLIAENRSLMTVSFENRENRVSVQCSAISHQQTDDVPNVHSGPKSGI